MSCKIEKRKQLRELGFTNTEIKVIEGMYEQVQDIMKSEPQDTTDNGYEKVVVEKGQQYNEAKMMDLFNTLAANDKVGASKEHVEHLRGLLKTLVSPVMKALPEMTVYMNDQANKNSGSFEVTEDETSVHVGLGTQMPGNANELSAVEKFVHEMVHAATYYALNSNSAEVASIKNRLKTLRSKAMEVLTVEDFMPDVMVNEAVERKLAEERLAYINEDMTEFVAYMVSNEKLVKKLGELDVYARTEEKAKGFVDALIQMIGKLVDVVMQKWRNEPKTMKGDALAMKLMQELMSANTAAARAKEETLLDKVDEKITEMEDWWRENIIEKGREVMFKKAIEPMPVNGSRLERAKWATSVWKELLTDEKHRGLVEQIMTSLGMSPTGMVQTTIRNIRNNSDVEERVSDLIALSGSIERQRENIAGTVGSMINMAFSKPLKEHSRKAVYKMLKDDGIQLIGKYGSSVKDYYEDASKRQAEVAKLEKELDELVESKGANNLIKYRIDDLVEYMSTGEGSVVTAKNATAIAMMAGTTVAKKAADPRLVEIIDTIVGLKLIDRMPVSAREEVTRLLSEEFDGMNAISNMHKAAIAERHGMDTSKIINDRKGFVREVYDDFVTSTVAPISSKKEMVDKGYTLVETLPQAKELDGIDVPMGLYVSKDMIRQKLNRSTFRYVGDKQEGRSLFEHLFKGGVADSGNVRLAKSNLMTSTTKVLADIMNGNTVQPDRVVAPIYGNNGNVINYHFNVSDAQKIEKLGLETDGVEAVARTFAHNVDEKLSGPMNKMAFDEVMVQMGQDYVGRKHGKSGHEYIMLDENSSNPMARDVMRIMPKDVKKLVKDLGNAPVNDDGLVEESYVKKIMGDSWYSMTVSQRQNLRKQLANGNVWMRADMVYDFLGVRDISLSNVGIMQHAPREIRTFILKLENFWKQVVQIYKVNTVIKIFDVVWENIKSNIWLGVEAGQGLDSIWNTYKAGWDGLSKYIEDEKRVNELRIRLMSNPNDAKLLAEKARLDNDMKNSPVKPLIDAGLYSHIMEDLNTDNFKSSNRLSNWLNEKTENAPEIIKTGVNYMYFTERTKVFNALQNITVKSDFVARYSRYIHQMEIAEKKFAKANGRNMTKIEKKEVEKQILRDVRSAFVFYAKPDDPVMQYMNDMGLLMFTKYATRITKVASNLLVQHPIRFALALAGQETLDRVVGTEVQSITEAALFSRSMDHLFYSPDIGDYIDRLLVPAAWDNAKALLGK